MHFDDEPTVFCRKQAAVFPTLAPLALDILAIPASSAATERWVSTAGSNTQKRSNRLKGVGLERKVLIQRNGFLFNITAAHFSVHFSRFYVFLVIDILVVQRYRALLCFVFFLYSDR